MMCTVIIVTIVIVCVTKNQNEKKNDIVVDNSMNEESSGVQVDDGQKTVLDIISEVYSCIKYDEEMYRDYIMDGCDSMDVLYDDGNLVYYGYESWPSHHFYFLNNKGLFIDVALVEDIDYCDNNVIRLKQISNTLTVDFNDFNSINEFVEYNSVKPFFQRYFYDHSYQVEYAYIDSETGTSTYNGSYVLYIDFPDSNMKYNDEISKWLADLLCRSLNFGQELDTLTSLYIYCNKNIVDDVDYNNNYVNIDSLSKFVADIYLDYVKDTNNNSNQHSVTSIMYRYNDLRVYIATDEFVTYQMSEEGYEGGAHGYYTQELVSFDPHTQTEIDFDYLFRPECKKDVEKTFVEAASKNEKVAECLSSDKQYLYNLFSARDDEGKILDELELPRPALAENGVCFSFQPYDISCYADGIFHIIVPYEMLKPYLTERAKELL